MIHPALIPAKTRFDRLDALRGVALLWMAAFHFCFDLSHFGLINANFYQDPFWTIQRVFILSLFLLCAGAGQAVAAHQGRSWADFWRRWWQVLGCALLVSSGSYIMFADSFIYFGVLHGMALMLLLARLTAQWLALAASSSKFNGYLILWPLGLLAMLLPNMVQHEVFNSPWLNWSGLVTRKPITQDYVPFLPWMGVVWWGMAGMHWLLLNRPEWLVLNSGSNGNNSFWRGLVWLGTWSLSFYMLHQPVMLGGLEIYRSVVGQR